MSAEIRDEIVLATEHIKAPPEVVFPYFTDPQLITTWLADRAELDPRPGGVFKLSMSEGQYVTLEPPNRVVFTWGVPGSDELPAGSSTVEVVLIPDGADTMVVLTHRGLPGSQLGGHRAGWDEKLTQLLAHVSGAL